jgi:hypothetical protein
LRISEHILELKKCWIPNRKKHFKNLPREIPLLGGPHVNEVFQWGKNTPSHQFQETLLIISAHKAKPPNGSGYKLVQGFIRIGVGVKKQKTAQKAEKIKGKIPCLSLIKKRLENIQKKETN